MTLETQVGSIAIGQRSVPRLGFGTMRLTGPRIFGEPADPEACVRTVRDAYEGGVRVFDTAWYYGPDVASRIVREALAPYPDDIVFVSKLGGARRENGDWYAAPTRDELRAGAERECRLLGVDHLPVVHLRWMEGGGVSFEEMLNSMLELREEGVIGAIGLSNINTGHLDTALGEGVHPATVSNAYGPGEREADALLDRCTELGIPFLPFFSLLTSDRAKAVHDVAAQLGASPAQIAIAWQLRRAPTVLPIPGTSRPDHLGENLAAAQIELSDGQYAAITSPDPGQDTSST
ncbi:MAG: pyridoxine 4-dehydrogenase [Nocardioidaceae bacterium]|jgi:aryl-alcohol dehydrogenase-like predicted oxidoreductase|nr:pyridoxine 4-dehydrogenase [Nocardioidaceae bacterium]